MISLPDWPRVHGGVAGTALLRHEPEDFVVEEQLGFTPEEGGEHLWLWIEKRNLNTADIVQQLSTIVGIPQRDIAFSGMKDRRAVTRQWFSLHLPGKNDPVWPELGGEWRILEQRRCQRKLRRGVHRANQFTITLRDFSGDSDLLEQRLESIRQQGFPNYFGEQRFGHQGQNISRGREWLLGQRRLKRHQKGIHLSAIRSWLFNQVLAERIDQGVWDQPLEGDVFALEGSQKFFSDPLDETIRQRLQECDIHISGPLPGDGDRMVSGDALAFEDGVLAAEEELLQGLSRQRVDAARRSLRTLPQNLAWQWLDESAVTLSFALPSGCFATALMRELVDYQVAREHS